MPFFSFAEGCFQAYRPQQPLTPSQLAEQANALSDLSRLGSYQLKAIVAVGNDKHRATGTLIVDHDQQNTRQELEFSDYHEVSLVLGDTGYFQRQPAISLYVAERIRDFDDLWWVTIPPESEIGAVFSTKVHGVHASCFAVKLSKFESLRYCFDAASHLLISRTIHGAGDLEILFQDYHELGGVHFPGTIQFIEPEKADMEVNKVAVLKGAFTTEDFARPQGVHGFYTCRHLIPPRSVKRVDPEFPAMARLRGASGDARLLVTVGENGAVREVRALSGHPMFTEAAINAVKQWEYKPAACPSGPVEDKIIVVVRFHTGISGPATSSATNRQGQVRTGTTGR